MSSESILKLQKETGCDPVLGAMLLKFTGGDYDGAFHILRSVEKDIYILKGKFIAQSHKFYGSFLIIYNARIKGYHKLELVVKQDDKSGIEFDFQKSWREYLLDLELYKKRNLIDIDKSEKILAFLKSQRVMHFFESKFVSKKDINEDEIRHILTDSIINALGDVNVAVKLKIEQTDIFELNRRIDTEAVFEPGTESVNTVSDTEDTDFDKELLKLKVEPVISPVSGVPVSELKIGDYIGVKIVDDRPVADYVSALLKGKNNETGESVMVYAALNDIKIIENGVFFTVEFGPGVYGYCYLGEDVNIVVKREFDDSVIDDDVQEKNNIFSRYFWIFGGLLTAVLVGLVILIIFNST